MIHLLMTGIFSDVCGVISFKTSMKTLKESKTVMPRDIFSPASIGMPNTRSDKQDRTIVGIIIFSM